MQCVHCGNEHGVVSRHQGKEFYAWFCSENECIQRSAEISKQKERLAWQDKHAKELNEANIEMKNRKKENKIESFNKYRFFNKGDNDE